MGSCIMTFHKTDFYCQKKIIRILGAINATELYKPIYKALEKFTLPSLYILEALCCIHINVRA